MKLKEWIMVQKKKREVRRREKLERKLGADPADFERKIGSEAEELENEVKDEAEELDRAIPIQDLELQQLNADTAGITPPESRYTEEYKEFIKQQELDQRRRGNAEEK